MIKNQNKIPAIITVYNGFGLRYFKTCCKTGEVDWLKGKKAEACVECGICETKCPQKLNIREQLKDTAGALGAG